MKIFTAFLVILSFTTSYAQPGSKSAFLEIGGPGYFTLNYDMRFAKKADGIGARTGFGWFMVKTDEQTVTGITVPIEVNYFIPLKQSFFLELGAGLLYRRTAYNNKIGPIDSAGSRTSEYLDLALRYQAPGSRFLLRAAFTPVLDKSNDIQAGPFIVSDRSLFGVSLGIRLGKVVRLNRDL